MSGAGLGLIVLLLALSALVATAQVAAFLVSPFRIRTLQEEGFSGSDALAEVRREAPFVSAGTRLFTGFLNLAALGIGVATDAFTLGSGGPWVDLFVGIIVVILVADVLPHVIAARNPVRIALAGARGLLTLVRFTSIISRPVTRLEEAWAGNGDEDLTSSERELREIREIGQEEGIVEEAEGALVERAFRLDELTAWDIMVPRVDIFAWPEDTPLADIHEELPDIPYSRVPVYRESVDDITGIVYIREIYERLADGQRHVPLSSLARDPFFVPGSLSCAQLLSDFQARRIHMGIVADEFGGTDGLVTLEDVLEELVGEIHDETDRAQDAFVRISDIQLVCDASADVRDINEALNVALPKTESRSLNGFILEELGHVPPEGESFERVGVRIDILEASDTQVRRARVTRVEDAEPQD